MVARLPNSVPQPTASSVRRARTARGAASHAQARHPSPATSSALEPAPQNGRGQNEPASSWSAIPSIAPLRRIRAGMMT